MRPPAMTGQMSAAESAIRRTIAAVPRGRVSTSGEIAEQAGYPLHHRQVAQILRRCGDALPWHRIVGAGGLIRTSPESAVEQRLRLQMEGVTFRGARVNIREHGFTLSGRLKNPRPRT